MNTTTTIQKGLLALALSLQAGGPPVPKAAPADIEESAEFRRWAKASTSRHGRRTLRQELQQELAELGW